MSSETEDGSRRTSGSAATANVGRTSRFFRLNQSLRSIDEDFETDLGFVRRTDLRESASVARWTVRPEGRRLLEWGPTVGFLYRTDQRGLWLDRFHEARFEGEWENEAELEIGYNAGQERLRPGDAAEVVRLLEFDTAEWVLEAGITPSKSFGISAEAWVARAINFEPPAGEEPTLANERGAEIEIAFRPLTSLRSETQIFFTRLEDLGGPVLFEDTIVSTRWNWQVSLPLSVRVILQWEETIPDPALTSLEAEESLNADLLLAYRFNPWTAAYLGYTQNRSTRFAGDGQSLRNRRDPRIVDRFVRDAEQVFIKISYLVR